jgi:hypothetical protein
MCLDPVDASMQKGEEIEYALSYKKCFIVSKNGRESGRMQSKKEQKIQPKTAKTSSRYSFSIKPNDDRRRRS